MNTTTTTTTTTTATTSSTTNVDKSLELFFETELFESVFDPEYTRRQKAQLLQRKAKLRKEQDNYVLITGGLDTSYEDTNGKRVRIGGRLILNVGFRSPAFLYQLECHELKGNGIDSPEPQFANQSLADTPIFCDSYTVTPIATTRSVMEGLLRRAGNISDEDIDKILAHFLIPNQWMSRTDLRNFCFREEISCCMFLDLNQELRRYLLFEELDLLSSNGLYEEKKLLELDWMSLRKLRAMLRDEPEKLCCETLYNFYWANEKDDVEEMQNAQAASSPSLDSMGKCEDAEEDQIEVDEKDGTIKRKQKSKNRNGLGSTSTITKNGQKVDEEDLYRPIQDRVKIPELELKQLEEILKAHGSRKPLTPLTRAWITMYKFVKNAYYEHKHTFCYAFDVEQHVLGLKDINDQIVAAAWDFLTKQHRILIREQQRVYRRKPFVHEQMMALALMRLELNFSRTVVPVPQMYKTIAEYKSFCADMASMSPQFVEETKIFVPEQMNAIHTAFACPLTIISGPGGSGKSTVLKHLIHTYLTNYSPGKAPNVLIAAFQKKNVADLAKDFPNTAICFTVHQLLLSHRACCDKCPTGRQQKMMKRRNVFISGPKQKAQQDGPKRRKIEVKLDGANIVVKTGKNKANGGDEEDEDVEEDPIEEDNEEQAIVGDSTEESTYQQERAERDAQKNGTGPKRLSLNDLKIPVKQDKRTKIFYKHCILEEVEAVFLDESSLLYNSITAPFLYALAQCAPKWKTLVFAGDIHQLPSIYEGNVLVDMAEVAKTRFNSCLEFVENHRQKFERLFRNSQAIKDKYFEGIEFDGTSAIHVPWVGKGDESLEWLTSDVLQRYDINPTTSHEITYHKHHREIMNKSSELHYMSLDYENQIVPKAHIAYARKEGIRPGSKILFKRNDLDEDVINNEILNVEEIFDISPVNPAQPIKVDNSHWKQGRGVKRYMKCLTIDGRYKLVRLTMETKRSIVKAFATTNHGFIGNGVPTIIIAQPPSNRHETNETMYTAFTRCTERCIFIGDLECLRKAIMRNEPPRNTSLSLVYRDMLNSTTSELAKELRKMRTTVFPDEK